MNHKQRVSEIMTCHVITVEPFDNLLGVARDMDRYHLRHIPVADDGKLVGLISHRDLLRYSVSQLESSPLAEARDAKAKGETFVVDVMTRNVETVRPHDTIQQAARKLVMGRFGCLPVVDDQGHLVGIVSEIDLLRVVADLPPAEHRDSDPSVA